MFSSLTPYLALRVEYVVRHVSFVSDVVRLHDHLLQLLRRLLRLPREERACRRDDEAVVLLERLLQRSEDDGDARRRAVRTDRDGPLGGALRRVLYAVCVCCVCVLCALCVCAVCAVCLCGVGRP